MMGEIQQEQGSSGGQGSRSSLVPDDLAGPPRGSRHGTGLLHWVEGVKTGLEEQKDFGCEGRRGWGRLTCGEQNLGLGT